MINKLLLHIGWKNLLIFSLLLVIVIYLQYDLLKPALKIGLTPDDWSFIFFYKLLGPSPLTKMVQVWAEKGPYTTVPIYYTGIINSLVGFNYQNLQIISIAFKVLTTLIIFPLIIYVFKNRLLAFLTTFLFAISYTSSGALETAVEPSEYLGMFWMCIFLIVYCHIIKHNLLGWKWLFLATALLIISVMFSVMRIYPLLILLPLVEGYIWIANRLSRKFTHGLLRLTVLYSPFISLVLYRPNVVVGYIGTVPSVIYKILEGSWHLILTPLQGVGHMFPINAHWGPIFGHLSMETFRDYTFFLKDGPTIIFGSIILFLAFIKSKSPWRFFLAAFFINLSLEILVYFIAIHSLSIPHDLRMNFDSPRMYSTIFGIFIMSLAFAYFVEWQNQGKKDNLFLAAWIGPAIAFLFVWLTWMLANMNLAFGGAQDHYLLIPTLGISLFISCLIIFAYDRINRIKINWLRNLLMVLPVMILLPFYQLNKDLIRTYFTNANNGGRSAAGQQMIQNKFRQKVKDIDFSKPVLFYFDTSDISGDGRFYTESFLSSFPFWMHIQGDQLLNGCLEVFYENKSKLALLIQTRDGERGFVYRGLCVENGKGGYKEIFYPPESFYAFKLKNRDFIDIKKDLLKELGI